MRTRYFASRRGDGPAALAKFQRETRQLSALSYDLVREDEPSFWLLMLHGIYGQGRNWSTVARRIVRARPDWGIALVDLRMHGASHGFGPPHTVRAAARDLLALGSELRAEPAAVAGHSFGGKVALAYVEEAGDALRQAWLLDSTPAPRPPSGSAYEMLQILRSLPDVFPSRGDLVTALERAGVATPVAQWMATNLEQGSDGYRWRFNLDAIEELLEDFFRADLWQVVESPPDDVEVHLVKATESSVLDGETLARVEKATASARSFLHHVQGGHWLNADNPDAVVDLFVSSLPR